jgi:DNA repair protein RadC
VLLVKLLEGSTDKDLNGIADALLATFGSLGGVVCANTDALRAVSDTGVATRLEVVRECVTNILRPANDVPMLLGDLGTLVDYLTATASYAQVEEVRVLFLGSKLQLIRDELMGRGCISEAPIYVRQILKRALDVGATSLVLAHNHPSGDPRPSRADEMATHSLSRGLHAIGVDFHDHLIVARGEWFSFRAEGLLG